MFDQPCFFPPNYVFFQAQGFFPFFWLEKKTRVLLRASGIGSKQMTDTGL